MTEEELRAELVAAIERAFDRTTRGMGERGSRAILYDQLSPRYITGGRNIGLFFDGRGVAALLAVIGDERGTAFFGEDQR